VSAEQIVRSRAERQLAVRTTELEHARTWVLPPPLETEELSSFKQLKSSAVSSLKLSLKLNSSSVSSLQFQTGLEMDERGDCWNSRLTVANREIGT
jgi:hypothetical protein